MRILLLLLLGISEPAAADRARDTKWLQDLDYLAAQLTARHPNLFFQTPQTVFASAVSGVRNAIPNLTDVEVMVGLAGIAALPRDGHTNLFLTQRNSTFRLLPLRVQWFEDGLFVTATGSDYTRAIGARVVQIGDRTTDQAYQAVAAIISHENDMWARETSPNYLVNADILQALKVAPDNASVPFVFEDLAGARFSLDIGSMNPGQPAQLLTAPDASAGFTTLYRQQQSQNYWFTYVASSRTLYFAYNVCQDMPALPFSQFNDQLWAVFDAAPVERLVIDLRNNSGGNSSVLNPFLASGAARQTRFYAVQPSVIVGRRTFSSAILNAISMKQGPVKLVGEPTGGSPNSYGEVLTMVLPNSQLSVNYSTRYFSFPNYPAGSMLPDVPVRIYSSDYFARHDPFLAAVLADAAPGPAGGQGTSGLTVANSASFRTDEPVAPGSLASVFGDFPGVARADAMGLPLAEQMSGVQVLMNGVAAPLIAVGPAQINFQVPAATASGTATVLVTRDGAEIAGGAAQVAGTGPALFVANPFDAARPGAVLDQNSHLVSSATPATRGSVIQIYATGQGATDPALEDGVASPPGTLAQSVAQPRVFLGSELAQVVYSGLQPSFPGLWQINVRVPESAAISGQTPIFVVMGSRASNAVTVPVGN